MYTEGPGVSWHVSFDVSMALVKLISSLSSSTCARWISSPRYWPYRWQTRFKQSSANAETFASGGSSSVAARRWSFSRMSRPSTASRSAARVSETERDNSE